MAEFVNLFPKILLGSMIVLTLVLLPLLNDDFTRLREDEQHGNETQSGTRHH